MDLTRSRWFFLAVGGLVIAALAATAAAAGTSGTSPPSAKPALNRAAEQPPFLPTGSSTNDPAVKLTPQGGIPFPKSLDNQPGMRHHSGGPYIGDQVVRQKASELLNCGSKEPIRSCDSIVVQFFPRYEDATNAHLKNGIFASGLASDREVYLVSVKGALDMAGAFRGAITSKDRGPMVVDHWNYQVDATTGDFISGGTAGEVLLG